MSARKEEDRGKLYTAKFLDPCRDQVVKLARLGCTDKEISSIIMMCEAGLKRHMRLELDDGRNNMRASLRKAQLKAAVEERNPTMLIWLGKCYLGQKEPKKEVEHSGALTVEKVMFAEADKVVQIDVA